MSALDVSIQAQILNLLMEAQDKRGSTYMFITHDLSVVEHISTRVAVMYLGTMCEVAPVGILFESPRHPYTQALLSAIPRLGRRKPKHVKLKGEAPTPIHLPSGCVFLRGRRLHAGERCAREIPKLNLLDGGSLVDHPVNLIVLPNFLLDLHSYELTDFGLFNRPVVDFQTLDFLDKVGRAPLVPERVSYLYAPFRHLQGGHAGPFFNV